MEREQIIKALECFHHRILNSNLAEKITEQEMMAIIDAIALINELIEEADRHKKRADRHFENLKSVLDERSDIEADTVRKMQESLKEVFCSDSENIRNTDGYIRYVIDKTAKKMLEEEK